MSGSSKHSDQAAHNIRFLQGFYKSHEFDDWAITVGFYTALHIVENAITQKEAINWKGEKIVIAQSSDLWRTLKGNFPSLLPANYSDAAFSYHVARNLIVSQNFPEIKDEYLALYKQSRVARYRNHLCTEIMAQTMINMHLKKIVRWSNKRFKTAFALNT